jgi:hypothetical protein
MIVLVKLVSRFMQCSKPPKATKPVCKVTVSPDPGSRMFGDAATVTSKSCTMSSVMLEELLAVTSLSPFSIGAAVTVPSTGRDMEPAVVAVSKDAWVTPTVIVQACVSAGLRIDVLSHGETTAPEVWLEKAKDAIRQLPVLVTVAVHCTFPAAVQAR